MKHKKYIYGVVICIIFLLPAIISAGINQNFKVDFVKSISSSNDLQKSKCFLNKVKDFIIGYEDVSFSKPNNIIAIDTANYFVLDQGNQGIVSINSEESEFEFLENSDLYSFPSLVGFCKSDRFNYFTDSKLNKIFFFDKEKSILELKTDITLNQPTGISYSELTKQLIVSETAYHRVTILNDNGSAAKYIGKRGTEESEFNFPTYNCTDKDGNLYINDAMNFRIQIFDKDGIFINKFGSQGDGAGYFASSKGLAVDSYGHIYVVDALFNTVQIFNKEGDYLYRFGKKGVDNGEFMMPTGIYIDKSDFIYVADSYNSRIQVFKLTAGNQNE